MEINQRPRWRYVAYEYVVTRYRFDRGELEPVCCCKVSAPSARQALSLTIGLHFRLIDARAVSVDISEGLNGDIEETAVMFWHDVFYHTTNIKKAPDA